VQIVDDVAGITPGWLTAVLQAGDIDATVGGITTEQVGTGQMGSCFRLRIDYETGTGPDRLVAKLPASDPSTREAGAMGYRCETSFYREIAHRLAVRVPRCYLAAANDDARSFTLLLEDLAPAQQGDQIMGCTVAQARDAAVNVAGLHAPTWGDASLYDLEWPIPAVTDSQSAEFVAAILGDATTAFVERHTLESATVGVLREFVDHYVAWAIGRPEPFSLIHGDYRLDNLMFAPPGAGDPVVAVDWQVVTIGLPLRDVGFLVSTGLSVDDRRAAERDIVADYHRALVRLGVGGYDEERCWEDYRHGLFQATMITVLGAYVSQRTERGDQMFAVMADRSATAITDLDAFSVL
jgi:aminoglycoside/choline kinase family phosphotransferase